MKIEAIVLTIKGQRVELTIDEAQELRAELNRALPPIPVPHPVFPPAWTLPRNDSPYPTIGTNDSTAFQPPRPFAEIVN